ncbi:hypothetical protein ABFO11_00010 [Anaerostipes caccae]|jgi:hypothetical protein|uniref:hypothetical protein n=1 Tax=Anaerostipes TaxID=207244 RepID=UPI000335FA90|nr:hypothetical protein [Anaerostipes sp. CAG:276]CDC34420.1 putative uncharacterized protein [Anaerostipes sp. CAG:276]
MIEILIICFIVYCILDIIQIKSNYKKQDIYKRIVAQITKQNEILLEDVNLNKEIINVLTGKEGPKSDEKETETVWCTQKRDRDY